ncbi:unnamed protein product [Closterium sp. Naga37s-1]|nr:unnamed protein product [Closterium sp. Naga37s-1]
MRASKCGRPRSKIIRSGVTPIAVYQPEVYHRDTVLSSPLRIPPPVDWSTSPAVGLGCDILGLVVLCVPCHHPSLNARSWQLWSTYPKLAWSSFPKLAAGPRRDHAGGTVLTPSPGQRGPLGCFSSPHPPPIEEAASCMYCYPYFYHPPIIPPSSPHHPPIIPPSSPHHPPTIPPPSPHHPPPSPHHPPIIPPSSPHHPPTIPSPSPHHPPIIPPPSPHHPPIILPLLPSHPPTAAASAAGISVSLQCQRYPLADDAGGDRQLGGRQPA